ncbi:Gdt1-like protein 1 protein [Salvia divinorum]|uniref:Gdt1-like protein 1 protein n=1 Tax=Salvia divinorum TaxID=28513 RepID=A0ABD1HLD1_SALDI
MGRQIFLLHNSTCCGFIALRSHCRGTYRSWSGNIACCLGGSLLGTYLSEKTIAYIGGTLFLVFAAVTLHLS